MNIFSIWGIKKTLVNLALSGGLIVFGCNAYYRIYLSKTTEVAQEAVNHHNNRLIFIECQANHELNHYPPKMPNERCLSFFKKGLPENFEFWGDNDKFPFGFTTEEELVRLYNNVQRDLKLYNLGALPPLSELTHGQLKSSH